ncbi:GNAT family N-acetyltransferase [Paraflavitalea speifideaquila]|uniref:GNAT family N-acetyltransferase n=1 Tax=Paraflavitalea speifideaquila TaxID=3076558 RepID=UPI0028E9CD78|nr:GNAT family N-acetyltransferase [Paraflavitalea speifideiaquila]
MKKNEDDDDYSDDRAYIIKQGRTIVATGGLMLNYNLPFADIYYEVHEQYRNKGLGSFIVQELKKAAYGMGRVPAARCNIQNAISRPPCSKPACGFVGIYSGRIVVNCSFAKKVRQY